MHFVWFKTPTPKKFHYKPRFYDEDKERLEQRKAELGLNSELTQQEGMRLQMRSRWRKGSVDSEATPMSKLFYFLFYAFVIIGGVYVIFFTDLVDKIVALFGVGK